MLTIKEMIDSKDPLADENIKTIIDSAEENILVDFKQTLDIKSQKAWLGITKDILAFHNTEGGFIVFGVVDQTYKLVGLEEKVAHILGDANTIIQKINKYIDPEINDIRSRKIEYKNKMFVVVYIPESNNLTFIFKKDGEFKYPTGQSKTEFREGTIYIRRSAGNHLVDSRDLDYIISKRLKHFKKSIFENIARVIEAPSESEVLLVTRDSDSKDAQKFIIDDSPEAIPIKGMSFTVEPKTDEHEIASSISINKRNSLSIPHKQTLWDWYNKRESLVLTISQKLAIARFCILEGVPCFYWLQETKKKEIKIMLEEAIKYEGSNHHYIRVMIVANFLGQSSFDKLYGKLGKNDHKVSESKRRYLKEDKFSLVNMGRFSKRKSRRARESEEAYRNRLKDELQKITEKMINSNPRTPNYQDSEDAFAFDCYLYAKRDNYKK